jgi:hypothetical protein
MKHVNSKAHQIRKYIAANPKAKPADIAKALGTGLQYVYTVMWTAKKKAAVKKKTTLTLPKPNWKSGGVYSSNTSFNAKLEEYEAKKSQEQVDKYWKAVGKVQKAALSPERIAELTIQAGKPRLRMQSSQDAQIEMFEPAPDSVNHPAHYKVGGIETIDFIEAKKLGYNLGNVVKYLTRADHKGNKLEDLRKAQWYLTREISALK